MRSFYGVHILLFFILLINSTRLLCQCSSYPVPFEQRISKAVYIVQGKVIEKHTYVDAVTGSINTLNKFKVAAWLKNYGTAEDIYVITLGGVYGNRAMRVDPALQLDMQHEYLLMLEDDNSQIDDKNFRMQHPQSLQLLTYADAQGSLTNENNLYHDLYYRTPKSEQSVFEEISKLTNQLATKPSGEKFIPRDVIKTTINNGIAAISGFSPGSVNAGTILAADYLTITGSGFGASAGTVFFSSADNGGAGFTSSGVASDIISWSDVSVVVKPAAHGGTGPININGTMTSASPLIIPYAHISIDDDYLNFPEDTRQRYYLRNKNGLGGYTYTFNTAFNVVTGAKNAFNRSLLRWRCNTFINWRSDDVSTSAITVAAPDGTNIVTFGILPVGVLGRATSWFSGSGIGGLCEMANTVWWLDELDILFAPDPPVAGFAWSYTSTGPGPTEFDFESVAMHELGHHHGLGHVVDPFDVMYYALANGAMSRTISGNNAAGGAAKVAYSTPPTCFDPPLSGTPMVALTVGNCTLPIELVEFRGERKNTSTNKLNWTTANEVNNRGFYLQRSADAAAFNDIVFIKGPGNNSQTAAYEFMDDKAGLLPWYYRLRQVDLDGREKISKTIFINGDNNTDAKVWAGETGDRVFVYVKPGTNNNAVLKMINSQGQQVLLKQITNGNSEMAVGNLPKAVYYYQLLLNSKIITGKLLLGTP